MIRQTLSRSTDFFLQAYDRGHKMVSLEEGQGSRPPEPVPRWAPGIYFGILIRQGLFMDQEFGQDL